MSAAIQSELERLRVERDILASRAEIAESELDEMRGAATKLQTGKAMVRQELKDCQAERDAHRTSEETQILLRQRAEQKLAEALEREQALAAHVEQIRSVRKGMGYGAMIPVALAEVIDELPPTSLDRRDLTKRSEALDSLANLWGPDKEGLPVHTHTDWLREQSAELLRQAESSQ